MGTAIQYLSNLVRGESLLHFDLLSNGVEGRNLLNVENIITGLAS